MAGTKGHRGWGRIRRLPSKRYQASYVVDMVRFNAPNTFGTKLDAERWLSDERRLIDRGEWTRPDRRSAARKAVGLTLGEYALTWIEHRPLKHRTQAHYRRLLAQYIEPGLGGVPLRHLSPQAVRSWHAGLDPAHPVINSHAYGLLHATCATAVTDELIEANPCHVRGAMHAKAKREPVILTVPEMAEIAGKIEPQRFRALVLICAWCGLRWGEVIELRRKDVSEDASTISVGRGATHRNGCHISTPKSGRPRTVAVPPHIARDLKTHLDARVDPDPESLLFPPTGGGCHLAGRSFRTSFDSALKTIGREGVRIHDLRHFSGSQVARVGSLRETMDHLGHSTPSASLRYQHKVRGRDAEIAAALSKLAEDG